MNGVGAIFYTGSPHKVNTRMNGLGTIARQDSNEGSSSEPKAEPKNNRPNRSHWSWSARIEARKAWITRTAGSSSSDPRRIGRAPIPPGNRGARSAYARSASGAGTCRFNNAPWTCHCSAASSGSMNFTSPADVQRRRHAVSIQHAIAGERGRDGRPA